MKIRHAYLKATTIKVQQEIIEVDQSGIANVSQNAAEYLNGHPDIVFINEESPKESKKIEESPSLLIDIEERESTIEQPKQQTKRKR